MPRVKIGIKGLEIVADFLTENEQLSSNLLVGIGDIRQLRSQGAVFDP